MKRGRRRERSSGRRRGVARIGALLLVAGLLGAVPQRAVDLHAPDQVTARTGEAGQAAPRAMERNDAELVGSPGLDEVAILPPPPVFDEAPPPPEAPPPRLTVAGPPPAGGTWAVIIGIDDYPGRAHDLQSAKNDARDIDAALARYGVPSDRRLVIHDRQASADTIRAAFDWIVARASADATAIVFYAGHVRRLSSQTQAIVASDGALVTDAEMAQHLVPLRARRTWLVMASCFGGGFTEALAPGRILTGAADSDSIAYENEAYQRSYLVEYMVRRALLERHADTTVESAFGWAIEALRRDHPDRLPVQFDDLDGELRLGAPPVAPPPAGPPPTAPSQQPPKSAPPPSPEEGEHECVIALGGLVRCSS